MFTDEIGDNLEEVKKYDEAEPISIPDNLINKLNKAEEDVDTEKEDKFNNVENVRYLEETQVTTLREENINMKIFGNPRIRKSQSFNQGMRPIKTEKSPECPKNSPLESVTSTPICSPVMVHKIHKIPSVDLHHKKSIEKSQSFCSKLSTIPDESFSESSLRPRLARLSLQQPQPQIVLTSPLDSPKVEAGIDLSSRYHGILNLSKIYYLLGHSLDKSRHFNASIEKLSQKLLEDGIETYLAIQHYVDTTDYSGPGQQSARRSSSSSCSSLPPPPSSAPPPLPSL